ncbi:trichohyalin-like [Tachysurus ichikawai]
MDPEMKEGLKGVEKRLKNFGPRWFQKLQVRNNIKRRQYLEKEIKRLELQLKDSKVREARSTEVINVLVKERVQMKRQLELGLIIFQTSLYTRPERRELMESKQREFNSTKVINALVKEREEMKKELHKEKERMVLELEKERKNMEKEKGQETFELLKREREAMEEFLVEKMIELRRMFQAEMERMEKKISEMANLQEMTEELEATEPKEGHETDDEKLKHVSITCSKKHRKKKMR